MKDGRGSIDFPEAEDESDGESDDTQAESAPFDATAELEGSPQESTTDGRASPDPDSGRDSRESDTANQFPYFVRRSNVLDERDTRLEIHIRQSVGDREQQFRTDLAAALGKEGEISKTDAREFALKYAFENPAGVAELLREDGYGLTD